MYGMQSKIKISRQSFDFENLGYDETSTLEIFADYS